MVDYNIFEAGDVVLQSGEVLRDAKLAYVTHGSLNSDKNNVVLYFTHFGAVHNDCGYLIGEQKTLDPSSPPLKEALSELKRLLEERRQVEVSERRRRPHRCKVK